MSEPVRHPDLDRLPVATAIPGVRSALADRGAAVLVAPPGAGKTTLVPLALLEEPWLAGGRIIVLEPRRLAARAAADRMSTLLGEDGAGGTVGYRVRNDTRVSARTRVEVVTEGVLTRMVQSDPSLEGVGLVVFDEFHERSLHADLGLALALQARAVLRPDLRLLVMSATLDAAPVARLLDDAPVVESLGRTYPVETRWRKSPIEPGEWIEPHVARAVLHALERDDGDVLVFLPGAAEIRRTEGRLREAGLPPDTTVHTLFGALPRHEQDAAISPSPPGRRKVVLATSIAETSLTIEGVRVVIDAGLARVPRFDPGTGMTRLETVRVTRDAADQRRGRAGRVASGTCYRLWTRAEDRGLVPHRRPEILEADLAPLALELAAWGAAPADLRWLDPPPDAAYRQALELLRELDAVDDDDAATDHGRRLAGIGAHPRMAHLALVGADSGDAETAASLAALLSERDILRGRGRAPDADLRLRLDVLSGRRGAGGHGVDQGALRAIRDEARRIRRGLSASDSEGGTRTGIPGEAPSVGVLTALAYPDRIARRRPGERGRFLLRNGRGARFGEPQPLEGEDWLAVADVEGRGTEARIFRAAPLTLAEIEAWFGGQIEEAEEVAWDGEAGRVVARRVRRLGALELGEAPLADALPDAIARALLDGIRAAGLAALPWSKETAQLRDRLESLHRLEPDRWPASSDEALEATMEDWLVPFLPGFRRLEDLRRLDLAEALLARLPWELRSKLDALAPSHIEVPSGSHVRVDYSDPDAPVLAVKLQEVFGMLETPRIAWGRLPLTMHLLSPAQRPVQVTQDLA
ncbi:MAG: ATP-dependent helicase HrpB, partial [Gemmatimonadetes bacterium]|nr:ATP-dependent helicase HrpB [Gemmatimonadota bacterium]